MIVLIAVYLSGIAVWIIGLGWAYAVWTLSKGEVRWLGALSLLWPLIAPIVALAVAAKALFRLGMSIGNALSPSPTQEA